MVKIEMVEFTITGENRMHCSGCEQRIGNALRRLPGVQDVRASAHNQQVVASIDTTLVSRDQVRIKLAQLGYQVESSRGA